MSGAITRADIDALSGRLGELGERLAVVETKADGYKETIDENRDAIAAQGAAVTELNSTIREATGTFARGVEQMKEVEEKRVGDLQDRVQDAQTWWDTWRSFLTPRNLVATLAALVVLGSLVTAILQGRADTSEVIQALHDLEALEAAALPAPEQTLPQEAAP